MPWTFQWSSTPVRKVKLNFSNISYVSRSIPVTVISRRHPLEAVEVVPVPYHRESSQVACVLRSIPARCRLASEAARSFPLPDQTAPPYSPLCTHLPSLRLVRTTCLPRPGCRVGQVARVCSCLVLGGEPAAGAQRRGKSARAWLPGAVGPLSSVRLARRPHHFLPPLPKQSRVSFSTLGCFAVVLTAVATPCLLHDC